LGSAKSRGYVENLNMKEKKVVTGKNASFMYMKDMQEAEKLFY